MLRFDVILFFRPLSPYMLFHQNPKWCLDDAVAIHLFRESFEPSLELFIWIFIGLAVDSNPAQCLDWQKCTAMGIS